MFLDPLPIRNPARSMPARMARFVFS